MTVGEKVQHAQTPFQSTRQQTSPSRPYAGEAIGHILTFLFAVSLLCSFGCTTQFRTGGSGYDSDTNLDIYTDTSLDTQADYCPNDAQKDNPGICGCGIPEIDKDGDHTPDCVDGCPEDPSKTEKGICGCGILEADIDKDGIIDCTDNCPYDPNKTEPGVCGCGVPDDDDDGDGTANCNDKCNFNPCVNGTCIAGLDSYSCSCDTGWTGANCNKDIVDCKPDSCVNGICVDGLNIYSCGCDSGWTGAKCDQDIDSCDFDPCINGTCTDGVGTYSCSCDAGWTGANCDRSIDDCKPDPCVNGTCIDGLSAYACSCDPGWIGTDCNQEIDECNPDPCVNGNCTDGINSYSCSCDEGWAGTNCDQEESCPTRIDFVSNVSFTDLIVTKGTVVHEYHDSCGNGQVTIGYHGFFRDEAGKNIVHGKIQALCTTPSIVTENDECIVKMGSTTQTPLRGSYGTLEWTRVCPQNEMIVGYSGSSGMDIDQITFVCAPLFISLQQTGATITQGSFTSLAQAGGNGGNYDYEDNCPEGQVATSSIIHTSNMFANAVGMGCQVPSLVF